jgi:crossover junction endodeoxyribonuclease RuvC
MIVLAVDPGYDRLGVAVMEKANGQETLIYSTCILTDKKTTIPERIGELGAALDKLLIKYRPDQVAVETLFFNKNQKTAVAVAEARGVVIYLARKHGADVKEFGPQEVKVATTGYGKSDKRAVMEMLPRLVKNLPAEALDDEYDAIAVALTAIAHHR